MTNSFLTSFAILTLSILQGCSLCGDEVVQRAVSPDGGLVATHYVRDCGATTDYVSILNLQPAKEKFKAEQGVLFSVKGEQRIGVQWVSPKRLQVTCRTCVHDNVYRQIVRTDGIDIEYDLPQ